jgi:hypothetical protein
MARVLHQRDARRRRLCSEARCLDGPATMAAEHRGAQRLGFHPWLFRCTGRRSVLAAVGYTLAWSALPLLDGCFSEIGMAFTAIATGVTLLRAAAHHLLPPRLAHQLLLVVACFVPPVSIFGLISYLRSFYFSWRLAVPTPAPVSGLWAVCNENSSPEVHVGAWRTMALWLPVQEFLLGLTQAITFHASPLMVASDVVLQLGIVILLYLSARPAPTRPAPASRAPLR